MLANANWDPEKELAEFEMCAGIWADMNEDSDARDVEAKRLGLAEAANGAWGQLPEEHFNLFEKLFEICRRPNEAEFDLLGRVVQTNLVETQQWCKFHIDFARNYTNLYCS